jgi:hypothetical protein
MAIEFITTPLNGNALNGNSGGSGSSASDNTKINKPTNSKEGMTAIVNPDGVSVTWDWEKAKWVKVDTSKFPSKPKGLGISNKDDDLQKILNRLVSFEAITDAITDKDKDTKIEVEKANDEDKIRFTIGGVNKGVWGQNGLGIGVTTPTALLDLGGTLRLRGRMKDGDNTEGTQGQVLSSTGTKTKWIDLGKTRFMQLAQNSLTGGGIVTHSSDRLKWENRFITIPLPRIHKGGLSAKKGHFNIEMPPIGTTIHGLGNAPDRVVEEKGIPFGLWYGLYYKIPENREHYSNPDNFYYHKYTYTSTIGEDMILIAVYGEDGTIRLGDGRRIKRNSGANKPHFLSNKLELDNEVLKIPNLEVSGYTKLGSDSPKFKTKIVRGTTSDKKDGYVTIPHGVETGKIISVTFQIQFGTENQKLYGFFDEEGYRVCVYSITDKEFIVRNLPNQADDILDKPITFFVIYVE